MTLVLAILYICLWNPGAFVTWASLCWVVLRAAALLTIFYFVGAWGISKAPHHGFGCFFRFFWGIASSYSAFQRPLRRVSNGVYVKLMNRPPSLAFQALHKHSQSL